MARNTKAGVRIAIGSDFDPKGFLAAEERTARLRELQLAESGTMAGAWVQAGHGMMTFGSQVETLGRDMTNVGTSLTRNVTLPIVAVGGAAVAASVEFESAFAGVTKTVDGTAAELDGIKQGIRDMAMELPASREEISNVAAAAGQLGIETPKILDFTRVMIDLGESTNLSAEEGATALARFANITGMSQDSFSNLGSSIVALGNNMATTEAEISEFALRIAGAGSQVGMTEPQILAIGAALSSVGIDAEAGGTAISKTMIGIESAVQSGGEQLDLWARTAGMSAEQFTAAWESDPATALNSVVQGLANMEAQGGSTLQQLELLGITEVRQRDALLRAAGAGDLLTQALQISGQAWEENSALAEEAGKRYETTESQWKILQNRLSDVGVEIGDVLVPALMDAVEAAEPMLETVRELAQQFSELDPQQQQQIMQWVALAAVMGPALAVTGQMVMGLGGLISTGGQVVVQVGKMGAQVSALSSTWSSAMAGTEALSVSTVALSEAYIVAAAAAGYMIGTLINQIPAVKESAEAFADAAGEAENFGEYMKIANERERTWIDFVVPWVTGAQQIGGALGYLSGETDKAAQLTSDFGLILDENGVPTEESIEALRQRNDALRATTGATDAAIASLLSFADATKVASDATVEAENADIAFERAKLRQADALDRVTQLEAEGKQGTREYEKAILDARQAALDMESAQQRAATAQVKLNIAITQMPRPADGDMQQWVEYYDAIGDAAGKAAAQANLANSTLRGGRAQSSTGGYNIPLYGTGAFVDQKHLAWVGDTPEIIFPLGDQDFAQRYLPMLLASLSQPGRPTVAAASSAPAYAPQSAPGGIGRGGDMIVQIYGSQRSYSGQLRALRDVQRGLVTVR